MTHGLVGRLVWHGLALEILLGTWAPRSLVRHKPASSILWQGLLGRELVLHLRDGSCLHVVVVKDLGVPVLRVRRVLYERYRDGTA